MNAIKPIVRKEEVDFPRGEARFEVIQEVGAGAADPDVVSEIVDVGEEEGAVPGVGVEVGGEEAELGDIISMGVGVGVEEDGSHPYRHRRLGLAEHGAEGIHGHGHGQPDSTLVWSGPPKSGRERKRERESLG